jgi:hypothetical protein
MSVTQSRFNVGRDVVTLFKETSYHDVEQVGAHQHHTGRLHCHIGAGAHGDAEV